MGLRQMHSARWFETVKAGTGPVYLRIADALARARADGTLQAGDRLPTQRDLAQLLKVDLSTITRAFTEARRRNLIEAVVGRGTFVTPGGWDEPVLDLSMNIPPAPEGINLPALIRDGIDAILRRSSAQALLSYHPGMGSVSERSAGSLWLPTVQRLPPGRVVVGAGAQALLAATVASLTKPEDVILADELTYPGLLSLARALGRRVAGVPSDRNGIMPDALAKLASETQAVLLYLNPTLHNPTTSTTPESRRRELIKVARRRGLTILEDDPYSRLLASAPPSFLAMAPAHTIHVMTLAKCISPFLRTAFLAAPNEETAERIGNALRGLTLMAAPLMTGLAAEWIRSGLAQELADGVSAEAAARRVLAERVLPKSIPHASGGFSAWFDLDSMRLSEDIVRAAKRRGLAVSPAGEFSATGKSRGGLRISLGAAATRARLEEGLRGLGDILSDATRTDAQH
jgi:DNA-binding transcriptional MocR family regulator